VSLQNRAFAAAILLAAIVFAIYTASHPMDFRVYHYGARGVLDGTRPVYGPSSGLGWPLHYRYPPLFLLIFAPFSLLPLPVGAAVWLLLKAGVLFMLLHTMSRRLGMPPVPGFPFLITFLFITPYIVEEFRYGNAQFFVIALTAVSLLVARDRPLLSAANLALAISVKVWPVFFLPYLLIRGDRRVVTYTAGLVVLLTLLPALYFGFSGNLDLLRQWVSQESQIQLGSNEIWFPNQSLRGVLMRYLTVVDYSQVPDSNYPTIHIAALDGRLVRLVWFVLAGAAYLILLVIARRGRDTSGWLEHGLAFCLVALLEPFTQKYALAVLLWPAVMAAFLMTKPLLRTLIYAAVVCVLVQPLAPGATAQRLLQVLGADFYATLFLTGAIFLACIRYPIVETRSGRIL
jgi:hypothetical protein